MSEEIDRLVEAARAYNRAREGANSAEDCPRCDDDYGVYCGQHTQLRAVARDAKRRLFDAVFAIGQANPPPPFRRERCTCHCAPCIRGACHDCTEGGARCANAWITFKRANHNPDAGADYETCAGCGKHIRHHYGAPGGEMPAYRCYSIDPCPKCGKELVAQASGVACSCGYMFCY